MACAPAGCRLWAGSVRALSSVLEGASLALVFNLCLFGGCQTMRNSVALGKVLSEAAAAASDAGTQWMVFVCAGIYSVAFVILRRRRAGGGRKGTRWNTSLSGALWLPGLLALAAVAYAFDYAEAVKSTQALTLLGAAMIGQGAGFWESRKQKVENRNGEGQSGKRKAECRNGAGGTVFVLVVLLGAAAVWQAETGHLFQYRGLARWSGP